VGCSKVIMGPGVIPWSMRAPRSMAAGGLPGMPRLSRGIMAPPTQALLAVSLASTPLSSPFAESLRVLGGVLGGAVGDPAGDIFTDTGHRADPHADQGRPDNGRNVADNRADFRHDALQLLGLADLEAVFENLDNLGMPKAPISTGTTSTPLSSSGMPKVKRGRTAADPVRRRPRKPQKTPISSL
jgi:hypothetical protein